MLNSCDYDKVKLLHQISCMIWFIEQHAKDDAKTAKDNDFLKLLKDLQADLDKYLPELQELFCK